MPDGRSRRSPFTRSLSDGSIGALRKNQLALRVTKILSARSTRGDIRRFKPVLEILAMAISTRFSLGISAAVVSLALAFAPAAFAADNDTMSKDGMKKDTMSKDSMSKDSMGKDSMKKDTMSKDTMSKDSMKKDTMGKDSMSK
jgi:pentapeptide MXKDX repeat protein